MKELLKRLEELVKSFINPIQPPKTFREEALASGLAPKTVAELERAMAWGEKYNFDGKENKEPNEKRKPRTSSVETTQFRPKPRTTVEERKDGFGRDD